LNCSNSAPDYRLCSWDVLAKHNLYKQPTATGGDCLE